MSFETGKDKKGAASDEVVALPIEKDAQLGRALLHALRNAGVSVLYQDSDLKTVWARNMRAPWDQGDEMDGPLPDMQAERLESARRKVARTAEPEHFELSLPGSTGMRWFDVWVDADLDENGHVLGIMTAKVETTEQKRREQTLKILLREVSHRSKNLLAIIQSIATQTGRYTDNVADFLNRFRGRLHSLASSQDLVTSSNWRGAELHELIFGQLGRYGSNPAQNLRLSGDSPYLNPNAALHIGLAMHELAVNSVSYGALSRPNGFVEVKSELTRSPSGDKVLCLTWLENIGNNDNQRNHKRFGSVALERIVPTSLNGKSSLEITGDRLEYRLTVPHGNFESD